jgi:pimeloyl-ACP methyl ester carboxylesterase
MGSVDRSGVEIHFEVEGDGPALVLHTGGGGDLRMWRMAGYTGGLPGRRLILVDHRGHGKSGRPTGIEAHRIDAYVDDVVAVADALGEERFGFFGYSAGAFVGYRLAARHPDRVVALVGLGTVGAESDWREDDDDAAFADRIRREGSEALVSLLREDEPDVPEWFADQMRETDPEMFALLLEGHRAWAGPWAEFPSIAARTLIVVGQTEEGDERSAGTHALQAAATIPNATAAVLPKLGHVMAFVRSDLVLPPVREFLDEVTPSPAAR